MELFTLTHFYIKSKFVANVLPVSIVISKFLFLDSTSVLIWDEARKKNVCLFIYYVTLVFRGIWVLRKVVVKTVKIKKLLRVIWTVKKIISCLVVIYHCNDISCKFEYNFESSDKVFRSVTNIFMTPYFHLVTFFFNFNCENIMHLTTFI